MVCRRQAMRGAAIALSCTCLLWPVLGSTRCLPMSWVTRGGNNLAWHRFCPAYCREEFHQILAEVGRLPSFGNPPYSSIRDVSPDTVCVLLQEELSNALILVYANKQVC